MDKRVHVDPMIGDAICNAIEQKHKRGVDIILIVFPNDIEDGQPTFVSSFPPEVMEGILKQIGEQIEGISASRVVVGSDTGLKAH